MYSLCFCQYEDVLVCRLKLLHRPNEARKDERIGQQPSRAVMCRRQHSVENLSVQIGK